MHGNVEEVVKALTAAIAPVFLLAGIGSLMASANSRYSRTIDRIRTLLREGNKLYDLDVSATYVAAEILSLVERAKTLRLSLMLMALSIFFVSSTILIIFAEIIVKATISYVVETSFLLSILALMGGVSFFMKDFASSLRSIEEDIAVRTKDLNPKKKAAEKKSRKYFKMPEQKFRSKSKPLGNS
ncbi:MAG: DUF2721 domain-containing protein [Oligoflexales bacterium]|nr:DUF2721 domain-containing protein [Oligoflexales bacterium]